MIQPCIDNGGYRAFGWYNKNTKKYHLGHDYNAPEKTDIKAIADGKVILNEELNGFGSFGGKGGVIILEHKLKDGTMFYALYGHLNRYVNYTQKIKEGDVIGSLIRYEQKTFRADHLHLNIWLNKSLPHSPYGYDYKFRHYIDPVKFIEDNK